MNLGNIFEASDFYFKNYSTAGALMSLKFPGFTTDK